MKGGRAVFVGGVPGSGKSTLCAAVVTRVPTVSIATGGALIRAARGAPETAYVRPPVADEADADRNQRLLVDRFCAMKASVTGPLLLDGHFVVPTAAGLVAVSGEVFAALGLDALVLVDVDAETSAQRLRQRGGAAWWDGSVNAIARLVDAERAHAEAVAVRLGLTLVRLGGEPDRDVARLIELSSTSRDVEHGRVT